MSNRIRIVSSSTSASETLMSPATTRPLSRTRSRTSTRLVDRACPSVSVGIGLVFYETTWCTRVFERPLEDPESDYLSNADANQISKEFSSQGPGGGCKLDSDTTGDVRKRYRTESSCSGRSTMQA